MPELPELEVLCERLLEALGGRRVRAARALNPFILRSVEPPLDALVGAMFRRVDRVGKHLLLRFESGVSLAIHLMRAGRLRLRTTAKPVAKRTLLVLEFTGDARLEMTEAGTEHRASVRMLSAGEPEDSMAGLDPLAAEFTIARFAEALRRENRQIKNALRSREAVAGIGNAYSDEILHAARLSPLKMTERLTDEEIARLHRAVVTVLREWIERVRAGCPPGALPEKQNLWRDGFVVHGRTGEPCPVCGTAIQRISYRDSETNYCPRCQTDGRLLADRRLSRFGIRRPAGPAAESD